MFSLGNFVTNERNYIVFYAIGIFTILFSNLRVNSIANKIMQHYIKKLSLVKCIKGS